MEKAVNEKPDKEKDVLNDPKNRKGPACEPLPAKPHFTPFRTKPERTYHPGKLKTTCAL
jgi:hypothetical protein